MKWHFTCHWTPSKISKEITEVNSNKLPSYGLLPKLSVWTSNFLSNRTLSVVVDGYCSAVHKINAGVPQAPVLAPTLCLLHINDLLSATKNPIHSFADDSTLRQL